MRKNWFGETGRYWNSDWHMGGWRTGALKTGAGGWLRGGEASATVQSFALRSKLQGLLEVT